MARIVQISADDGSLLGLLAGLTGARRAVEFDFAFVDADRVELRWYCKCFIQRLRDEPLIPTG